MSKYDVDIAIEAATDLLKLKDYISNQLKNTSGAINVIKQISNQIFSLEEFPYRHNIVVDGRLAVLGLRKIIIANYIIFYFVDEEIKKVNIVRVLYKRRDWENII